MKGKVEIQSTPLKGACLALALQFALCNYPALCKEQTKVTLPSEVIEARKLLDAGQKEDCEGKLNAFLREQKDNVDASLLHADVLYQLGRFHYAADEMKCVLAVRPNDPDALLLMGKIWQSLRKPALAVDSYKKYLSVVKPGDSRKEQYVSLIGILESQAKEQIAQMKSRRAEAGDYLAAIGLGGSMRWSNPESIKVFVTNGSGVSGYRPEFEESLRQAFDDWAESTEGKVGFVFVDKPEDAQMTVIWTNDLHAPALKAEAGHAQSRYGANGIEHSDISLLTVDPLKDGPIGRNYLFNVCLHEIGHALGLQGHSPHQSDIMYPSLYTQQGLSPRDVNTLIALYSQTKEQAENRAYVDEWGRPLTPKAKAQRLSLEGTNAAMSGDFEKAIEKLEEALQLNPEDQVARKNLAVAANNLAVAKQSTPQTSIELLRKALRWDPADETLRKNLEMFLQQSKATSSSP